MRRLLLILLFIPSLVFATFTEFYCESGGSQMNGGSNAGTKHFGQTNGNWSTVTNNYTVTNGHNPVSDGVVVGDFASVFNDGATTPVYIARVTAVQNATNGTITLSTTAIFGTAPTTSATGRSINVGGAWKGPSGTDGFPMSSAIVNLTDSSSDRIRVNIKNDQTYSVTANITVATLNVTWQGYGTTVGDTGKATLTNSANAIGFQAYSGAGAIYRNLIFANTSASGTNQLFFAPSGPQIFINCVWHGGRGSGFQANGGNICIGCEFYDNNKSNTALVGSYRVGGQFHVCVDCYIHDNAGSNGDGISSSGTSDYLVMVDSIVESNAGKGINFTSTGDCFLMLKNSNIYNNTGDGLFYQGGTVGGTLPILINTNFLKNGGAAINLSGTGATGFATTNGYGSGTQANGADTLRCLTLESTLTYASGVTPWSAPTTGNFTTTLPAAYNSGWSSFTETDGTNSGTLSYPDMGASQHNDTCGGTGPCQTSYGSAH